MCHPLSPAVLSSSVHRYELKLITCTYGNTSLHNVLVNVRKCIAACGLNTGAGAPRIVAGAARSLLGHAEDASYFHGVDGLGDVAGLPPSWPPVRFVELMTCPGMCQVFRSPRT